MTDGSSSETMQTQNQKINILKSKENVVKPGYYIQQKYPPQIHFQTKAKNMWPGDCKKCKGSSFKF